MTDSISLMDETTLDENDSLLMDSSDISIPVVKNVSIVSNNQSYENYYTKKKNLTYPMTKFEKAKIIGIRSEMLANGAQAMVTVPKNTINVKDIALLELEEKKIPLLVRRFYPNKEYEDLRVEDLIA